jgi:3-hydroxyisobutyrate dehydrogenase
MTDAVRVAVLGLGTMGRAFAVNLHTAGFDVTGYNRSTRPELGDLGFPVHDDAAAALRGADVVIVMLTDAAATSAVLLDPRSLEAFEAGAVVVGMGTIGVAETKALARSLGEARPDLVFVDAPVSGSKAPAEAGTVTVLASSDADGGSSSGSDDDGVTAGAAGATGTTSLRERLAPVFDVIGRRTVWLGATGAGSAMKIVVNTWLVHVMQGIAETALLADRLGITPEALADTLQGGPLDTPYAASKLRKIAAADYSTEMALALGAKDARLALAAGDGLDLPVSELIASLWTEASAPGSPRAAEDVSAVYESLRSARP